METHSAVHFVRARRVHTMRFEGNTGTFPADIDYSNGETPDTIITTGSGLIVTSIRGSGGGSMSLLRSRITTSPGSFIVNLIQPNLSLLTLESTTLCGVENPVGGDWVDVSAWPFNCVTEQCDDCVEGPCPGDLDSDGVIGGTDLALVLANWGCNRHVSGCRWRWTRLRVRPDLILAYWETVAHPMSVATGLRSGENHLWCPEDCDEIDVCGDGFWGYRDEVSCGDCGFCGDGLCGSLRIVRVASTTASICVGIAAMGTAILGRSRHLS